MSKGRVGCKPRCLAPGCSGLLPVKKQVFCIFRKPSGLLQQIKSLLEALAALLGRGWSRDRACGLSRRVGLRNAETGVQCRGQVAQQVPAVMDTAPEGLAEQPASSPAPKWYLNSQLTGLERVPAQQKGSRTGSSACQESLERRGSRVALPIWRGIFPSSAWELLHNGPSRSGGEENLLGKAAPWHLSRSELHQDSLTSTRCPWLDSTRSLQTWKSNTHPDLFVIALPGPYPQEIKHKEPNSVPAAV